MNSPKRFNILQLLPALNSGGVENEVIKMSKLLQASNYNSFVISNGGNMVGALSSAGVIHATYPVHSKNPVVVLLNIFRLRDYIKNNKIDLVHAHSRIPAWIGYFAVKSTKCKFITTVHGAYSGKSFFKKLYNSVMLKGEIIIAVSNFIKDFLLTNYIFDEQKLRIVRCAIDANKFNYQNIDHERINQIAKTLRVPLDKPIILIPGRIVRNKGHYYVIEALKLLNSKNYTCLIVGSSKSHIKLRLELQQQIKQANLGDQIIIADTVSDMPALYALSDIIISSSIKEESLGLTSLEGQIMGKLVIATGHGGSLETVIDGVTGWHVQPRDINDLKNAIDRALNLPQADKAKILAQAEAYVKKEFSEIEYQKNTLHIYQSLLG
jgi:glycosyltransferase involved in cell wall biosynthesis